MKLTLARRFGILMPLLASILSFHPLASSQPAPKRVALLVGVGEYIYSIPTLQGPPHDVTALREVLMRRWGFRAQDIKTLVNGQATRVNIKAELSALAQRSSANDEVLVYFSGHGTSNIDGSIPLPYGTGAFVPVDFQFVAGADASGLIVGRTDLSPVFSSLESGGRRLWVISDSCYSGQQVRSVQLAQSDKLPERRIPLLIDPTRVAKQSADLEHANKAPSPDPYPYRATAFLSASSEGEVARDIPQGLLIRHPTIDGKPHGAMTDALLRVLEGQVPGDFDGDGFLSLNEVHRATSDFMAQRAYGHTPNRLPSVTDDGNDLGNRPVLNVRNVALRPSGQTLQPLRVRMDSAPAALTAAISSVRDVRLVKPGEPADIVVQVKGKFLGVLTASGDLLVDMQASAIEQARAQVSQLAWAQHLRELAEQNRRAALQVDIDPAAQGGNFRPGDEIRFVVRPDKKATVVLINIQSDGKVSVLYPQRRAENQPLPAGQAHNIPAKDQDAIKVQEPFGMDMQFVFAFDEPLPELDQLNGLVNQDTSNPYLMAFERRLSSMTGKFTFASTNLRTLKP